MSTAGLRLITLMCDEHRAGVLATWLWPSGYIPGNHNPGNNSCDACGDVGARQPYGTMAVLPVFDQDTERAFHEAGHVVAFWTLGVSVLDAHLTPGDAEGSQAHVTVEDGDNSTHERLIGIWGGQVAQRLLLLRRGLYTDQAMIDIVASNTLDADDLRKTGRSAADLAAAGSAADELLDGRWTLVEQIAEALLKHRHLDLLDFHAYLGPPGVHRA